MKCAICGAEFEKRVYNQKYCSAECAKTARIAFERTRRLAERDAINAWRRKVRALKRQKNNA